MTNTKIKDMIETIEQFAQSQPDFPVYNFLGEVHTYGDLKADSDSLAAKIDSLDIPEKFILLETVVQIYGNKSGLPVMTVYNIRSESDNRKN